MVRINLLKTRPGRITGISPKQVTFTWEGDVDDLSENPVEIELAIQSRGPLFFLDENDQLVKKVFWTETFDIATTSFEANLFLKVKTLPANLSVAVITMIARGQHSESSPQICTIQFS